MGFAVFRYLLSVSVINVGSVVDLISVDFRQAASYQVYTVFFCTSGKCALRLSSIRFTVFAEI